MKMKTTVTLQSQSRPVALKHPDGRPMRAGDLKPGAVYEFDRRTGVTRKPKRKVSK
jgi:hypothetical protein